MKIYSKNWLTLGLSSILLFTVLNSCVKNRNDLATDFSHLTPVVELIAGEPITTGNPVRFKSIALDISPQPTNLNIYVNYAAPGLAPNDIDVTLALDQATLDAYNDANGTDYQLPSSDVFSFPTKVTIKKGERFAVVPVTVNTTKVDLSVANAIALKIVDASGVTISANNEHLIYSIGVKNKYDGEYDLTLTQTGWGAYGIADGETHTTGVALVTESANQVVFAGDFQPAFTTGGGATAFGGTRPIFTFDLATDKLISVINDPSAVDSRNRQFALDPSANNYYDAATKTIYATYIMTQNGRPPQKLVAVMVYTGPRP
jgi:hypothetical protein